MSKFQKKILIGLFALLIACPIGILLPAFLHSEDAWGEWDLMTIKKKTGMVPKGMAKDAAIWQAPVPDYQMGNNASLLKQSFHYIFSAGIGIVTILLITIVLIKFTGKNGKTS